MSVESEKKETNGEHPEHSVTGSGHAGTIVPYGNGSYLKLGDNKFEGTKLLMTIMAACFCTVCMSPRTGGR
jgi:hypothetical protein